ncbi:TonB-dependent receptor plug domain-containing protein, partial [Glaciecola sp. HTCC2999]|uniref:TonB-dependent receptor plug domain-containing protein n=1 Tax=Glaciecola sp. HTCC2999 TaxID=455436 RepID=UPI0000E0FD30
MKYHALAQAILFSTTLTIVATSALAQNVADVSKVPDASDTINASNASTDVEVINVFGDYSQLSLDQIAQSATIISAKAVQQRHVNHIDGLLNMAPNVNFTSGASRGKYIQIRGIGERSQFGEPLNPSVGLVLDGMDVSGLGGIATLLDVAQVEILRGPQATVFGTSGLAGVVNIVSNGPTDMPSGTFSVKAATQNTFAVNGAYGLRLDNGLGLRAAVAKNTSDGFVKNAHLGRDDTSNIDETSVRLRGDVALTDTLTLDAQILYVDAQNGYDAFSLDNDNVTLSDEPGVDNTEATVMGFGLTQITDWGQWRVQGSATRSDSTYGYDEDWTFVGFHPWEYSSTDYYFRERDTDALEFQARSSQTANNAIQWVGGLLHKQSTDYLVREYTYEDSDFTSQYVPTSTAIYGQITYPLDKLPGMSM